MGLSRKAWSVYHARAVVEHSQHVDHLAARARALALREKKNVSTEPLNWSSVDVCNVCCPEMRSELGLMCEAAYDGELDVREGAALRRGRHQVQKGLRARHPARIERVQDQRHRRAAVGHGARLDGPPLLLRHALTRLMCCRPSGSMLAVVLSAPRRISSVALAFVYTLSALRLDSLSNGNLLL